MINIINHPITIDLANKINMIPNYQIKKNDNNSHKFVFTILNNSVAYPLTGQTARIYFQKLDTNKVFLDCTIDDALNGKLSSLLSTQCLSYAGAVATEITFYGTNGEILTSITFNFTVVNTIRDDAAIQSSSEFTALTNALVTVNNIVSEVQTARGTYPNLDARLDNTDTQLADKANNETNKDIKPTIIDMHYGALRGVGFLTNPSLYASIKPSVVSVKGSYAITIALTTSDYFAQGELLSILASDGKYYTNVVDYLSGNTIALKYPLEADLDTVNSIVYGAYANYSHLRDVGFNAVADYAVRKLQNVLPDSLIARTYLKDFTLVAGATKISGTLSNYNTPGTADFPPTVVTTATTGDGIETTFTIPEYGDYKFVTYVNGYANNNIKVQLTKTDNTVIKEIIVVDNNTVSKVEFFSSLENGDYKIRILAIPSSALTFSGHALEVYKCTNKNNFNDINTGVHLLLGDSWFGNVGIFERLTAQLPKATIINYGVGGNAINNLIRRFSGTATSADNTVGLTDTQFNAVKDATTIPKIDYVWVMCGTNDYLGNYSPDSFKSDLKKLISLIIERGAKPIIFNSSVGDIAKNAGAIAYDIFGLSRRYADLYFTFFNHATDIKNLQTQITSNSKIYNYLVPFNVSVTPWGRNIILSMYVNANESINFERLDWNLPSGTIIHIGYATTPSQTNGFDGDTTVSSANASNINMQTPGIISGGSRYLQVVADHSSADLTVNAVGSYRLTLVKP